MTLIKRMFLLVLFALPLAACDTNEGPAEELGEDMDNAAEETRDAVEEAGDDIEDATD